MSQHGDDDDDDDHLTTNASSKITKVMDSTSNTIVTNHPTTSGMSIESLQQHHWNRPEALAIPIVLVAVATLVTLTTTTFADPAFAATLTATTTTVSSNTPIVPALLDGTLIFQTALKKAVGGGKAGALAAVVQVVTLMWLRTCMNYQYRYGGNLVTAFSTLYQEGGIVRLYQGLPFALVQGPLTRFGDTAANVGILSLLDAIPLTQTLPLPVKTLCGSVTAGLWRILLMPIDTSKTSMQVEGSKGLSTLYRATMEDGPGVLYRGSLAQAAATAVGHFPWFLTYNFFNDLLPVVDMTTTTTGGGGDANTLMLLSLGRSALLGLLASCVSDCASNSLRVIKTTKQTAQLRDVDNDNDDAVMMISNSSNTTTTTPLATSDTNGKRQKKELTYWEVIQLIVDQDGIAGLFGRGLQTRLLTNAIQGAMFSVLWKYFQQQ